MRTRMSFSALIRWRSDSGSVWELDTRHSGFPTAEAAAIAANGLGVDGFAKLLLTKEKLYTVDVNGRREPVTGEVVIWELPVAPPDVPEDMRFERVKDSLADLSARGLDGVFSASRFRVVEDESEVDVDIRLSVAQSQVVVLVRGRRGSSTDDVEVPTA